MSRLSYILFVLMLVGFAVSLTLFNQVEKRRLSFQERINRVSHVLLLLERTERLKNTLLDDLYDQARGQVSFHRFSRTDLAELNSTLSTLHRIVLYDEQRARIDTLRQLFETHLAALDSNGMATPSLDNEPISRAIERAEVFARVRLEEQRRIFDEYDARVHFWRTASLIISLTLFVTGAVTAFAENRARRRLKRLHEEILANASIGIAVFSMQPRSSNVPELTFFNAGAMCAPVQSEGAVLVNLTFSGVRPALEEWVKQVHRTGQSITREIEHQEGERRFSLITTVSRVSHQHVALYYQDITGIKSFEQQLKLKVEELESVNRDLEQFAHATSHDLREPFRKIQVMADLLKRDDTAPDREKRLNTIQRAAVKGSELVQQILNYSKVRFDTSELSDVDLNEVLARIIEDYELLIQEKGARVHVAQLPTVRANRIQMVQLFSNLIGNALKFTDPSRQPEVNVLYVGAEQDTTSGQHALHQIQVIDNGIGFAPDYNQKIFTAFQRLNNYDQFPGFGLGLSLCKKIVLNHGGRIDATSTPGVGSTFSIWLKG